MTKIELLKARGLPDQCMSVNNVSGEMIVLILGERGYHEYTRQEPDAQAAVDRINKALGVTKAQHDAMMAGSMCGWDVPGADPKMHEELPERSAP